MSISYFNQRGSGTVGTSPFYQIKRLLNPSKTNIQTFASNTIIGNEGLDVWRSAVANNNFLLNTTSQVRLRTIDPNGNATTLSDTNATSYLASGEYAAFHLSTSDQCLYCLIENNPTGFALIKINDASGVASAIGSPFTPATPYNWPQQYSSNQCTMLVNGLGNIEITFRGHKHQLNKTTGAIISQDVPVVIGSYNATGAEYTTADGTIASKHLIGFQSAYSGGIVTLPFVVSSSSGFIPSTSIRTSDVFSGREYDASSSIYNVVPVDSDKLFLGNLSTASGSNNPPFGYVLRADYDQFLQSVVDWALGV